MRDPVARFNATELRAIGRENALEILPAAAHAQASITGVVRDTSGGVLPGVTVEVASPALIEKVRSVATDSTGQYRIENLRPGTYSVTVTLPGFTTSKREGIELTGTFTALVNAEMRVGTLEETIMVSGESPVVDVQSTTREQVFVPVAESTAGRMRFMPPAKAAPWTAAKMADAWIAFARKGEPEHACASMAGVCT